MTVQNGIHLYLACLVLKRCRSGRPRMTVYNRTRADTAQQGCGGRYAIWVGPFY